MKKEELVQILEKVGVTFNEGVASDVNAGTFPKVVFWDFIWEDQSASGNTFNEIETYQISFYARKPRDEKLLKLREELRKVGQHVVIQHEYNQKDKLHHSFFSLEVLV